MISQEVLVMVGFVLTAFFLAAQWRIYFMAKDMKRDIQIIKKEVKR